ncbi:MAG: C4-dicarboxylate-specific signal transduction histidine kinase [Candidatus Omnitrophota bacterium]|jgi:C4-dicarboxylate-specific signal transduction histidine kinase
MWATQEWWIFNMAYQIASIMIKHVITVGAHDTIREAVLLMTDQPEVSALIVVNKNKPDMAVGIFTERDFKYLLFKNKDTSRNIMDMKVKEFMSSKLIHVTSSSTDSNALQIMKKYHIRHIPVIDQGILVGLVSIRDLMDFNESELKHEIREKTKINKNLQRSLKSIKEFQLMLKRSGRMVAMGEVSAGVAHEMNQPLMGLTTYLESLSMHPTIEGDAKLKTKVDKMRTQFQRLGSIVKRMTNYSKNHAEQFKPMDIAQPLEDSKFLLAQQLKDLNIEIKQMHTDDLPRINGDTFQLQDVIMNFIVNARDAVEEVYNSEEGGCINTMTHCMEEEGIVIAAVVDNGKPIPEDIKTKIFDSFFTTKGPDKGTGLGLHVCQGIVEAHNGIMGFATLSHDCKYFYIAIPKQSNGDLKLVLSDSRRVENALNDILLINNSNEKRGDYNGTKNG